LSPAGLPPAIDRLGTVTERLFAQGVVLLIADYRLLSPSTGHDILEDIQDLFAYVRNDLNPALAGADGKPKLKINVDAIGVAGTSAGGLCSYLCAIHISPKPRVLLSMYGQAGECLVRRLQSNTQVKITPRCLQNDHFLEPKTKPFLPNEPLLDPSDFSEFIFPQSTSIPVTAEFPYYPPTHPTPETKRMYLFKLYYQLGEWLDYYTGDHTLSARLRQLRSSMPDTVSAHSPMPSITSIAVHLAKSS